MNGVKCHAIGAQQNESTLQKPQEVRLHRHSPKPVSSGAPSFPAMPMDAVQRKPTLHSWGFARGKAGRLGLGLA
jgi:hypothetical protein